AKWSRRHKPIVWSAAVSVFVLLVVGVTGLGIGNVIITKERDEKAAALQAKTNALEERDKAYTSAEAERRRAEGNLDLALAAMDAVYLDAIGRDKLLGAPVAKPDGVGRREAEKRPALTDLERELLKRGLDFYDQFAQKNADAPRAFVQTAQAYYRVGLLQGALGDTAAAAEAYRGAVERFEQLTQEDPENAEHFRRLGEAYVGLGNILPQWSNAKNAFESAQQSFTRAIKLHPSDASLYLKRGNVFNILGDLRAGEDYDRTLELAPDNVNAILNISRYHESNSVVSARDTQKSRQLAERATKLAPNNPDAHLLLAQLLWLEDAEVVITGIGKVVYAVPDPKPALESYQRAIQLAPNRPGVYAARAGFYANIGDTERALIDLNRALELKPADSQLRRIRVNAYINSGQLDKALDEIDSLLLIHPNDAGLHEKSGTVHLQRGNWQKAVISYSRFFEMRPSYYVLYKRRAIAYVKLGEYKLALEDLKRALRLHPKDTSTLWWISATDVARSPDYFQQGLLELAHDAVERSPDPAKAYADRGSLHKQLKDYEGADADFAKAASLNPKRADTWHGWGHAYMARGMKEEAREKYSKAIELNPDHWLYWSGRGRANFRLHDFEAAVNDFSRVLELHPAYDEASSLRIVAYIRSGRLDEARADLEQSTSSTQSAEHYTHYRHALCWLMLEEAPKYRDACTAMLGKFGETDNPMAANFVAWTCSLAPDAVEDYEPVLALAAKAVEAQPDSDQSLNTLGAVLCRAGRHDDAIERLTELDRRRET
ncbi:MAG: tetratricopeptide repeat protein, partial [Planctomycetes bacterium]|nr:tetratricopeptide repeat protein [Planctomycetota bacterium]